jgi:hypothetical protein
MTKPSPRAIAPGLEAGHFRGAKIKDDEMYRLDIDVETTRKIIEEARANNLPTIPTPEQTACLSEASYLHLDTFEIERTEAGMSLMAFVKVHKKDHQRRDFGVSLTPERWLWLTHTGEPKL